MDHTVVGVWWWWFGGGTLTGGCGVGGVMDTDRRGCGGGVGGADWVSAVAPTCPRHHA